MVAEHDVAACAGAYRITAGAANDDVVAVAQRNGVGGAYGTTAAVRYRHARAVVADHAIVAQDHMLAPAGADGIGAEAAHQRLAAVAGGNDVVAAGTIHVAGQQRQHASGAPVDDGAVADDQVGAGTGADGVAAQAADDDIVAVTRRDDVGAAAGAGAADSFARRCDTIEVDKLRLVADDQVIACAGAEGVAAAPADQGLVASCRPQDVVAIGAAGAGEALNDVGGVALDAGVVAHQHIVAGAAVEQVDAVAPDQHIIGAIARQAVVARAAVNLEEARHAAADVDAVVAAAGQHARDFDHARGRAAGGDHDGVVARAAADLDAGAHQARRRIEPAAIRAAGGCVVDPGRRQASDGRAGNDHIAVRAGIRRAVDQQCVALAVARVDVERTEHSIELAVLADLDVVVAGAGIDGDDAARLQQRVADQHLVGAAAKHQGQVFDGVGAGVDAAVVQAGQRQDLEGIPFLLGGDHRVAARGGRKLGAAKQAPDGVLARARLHSVFIDVDQHFGDQAAGVVEIGGGSRLARFGQHANGDPAHITQELVLLVERELERVQAGAADSEGAVDGGKTEFNRRLL